MKRSAKIPARIKNVMLQAWGMASASGADRLKCFSSSPAIITSTPCPVITAMR